MNWLLILENTYKSKKLFKNYNIIFIISLKLNIKEKILSFKNRGRLIFRYFLKDRLFRVENRMFMPNLPKVLCSATRSSSSFSSDFVRGFFISKSFITSKSSKCLIIPQIINMAEYRVEPRGSLYNDNFRLFFKNGNGELISPMHDIPMA